MPSSDRSNMLLMMDLITQVNPKSILDVGPGCGKYGLLIREYLDGHRQKRGFHLPQTWDIRLDCVEAFPDYITPAHEYIYNRCYKCKIQDLHLWSPVTMTYDLILMGDVIEHMPKDEGISVLNDLRKNFLKPEGRILISTPNFKTDFNKPMPFGNEFERHHCQWDSRSFKNLSNFKCEVAIAGKLLTVLLRSKP